MKYLLLSSFAILMSVGQILFKKAAMAAEGQNFLLGLINGWMFVALALYGVATLLWVWILKQYPLSAAYPFVALAFVLVPIASVYIFDEAISVRYMWGCAMIIGGIVLTAI